MIYLISNRLYPNSNNYSRCSFEQFMEWVKSQTSYELDIETNVVEDITLREIYVVQFGSSDEQWQFVIDVGGITGSQLEQLKTELKDDSKTKVGFNLSFEYSVIKQVWGVEIGNLFDVMILLKLVLNGKYLEESVYNLAGAVREYLGIDMSKEEQTSFTSSPMTEAQIIYAGTDVKYCTALCRIVYSWELEEPTYEWNESVKEYYQNGTRRIFVANEMAETIALRMRALPGISEILLNPFKFNKSKWDENIRWAQSDADKEYENMCSFLRENMWEELSSIGYLKAEDSLEVNWGSNAQKTEILKRIYPDLANTKIEALRKFAKTLPEDNYIDYILDKQYSALNHRLVAEQKSKLVGSPYFFQKGDITLNFGSPKQRLELFKIQYPHIGDTKEETLEKLEGPLIDAYKVWVKKTKLVSSYGENWYNFICSDGNIRARMIDPVLVTGRVAISKPGLQTVPADAGFYLGNRYREPFEAFEDEVISAVDFGSQELNIIAELSNEPSWIKANNENLDIHSISAGKIFGSKWVFSGGDPDGNKDNVKLYSMHAKEMRDKSKTMSFGLAFGLGANGASKKMDCSKMEAQNLIDSFYAGLPALDVYFDKAAKHGQLNGWIATPSPFNFRRNFSNWNSYHINNGDYEAIGRESKNFRIQAMAAEQSLQAIYLIDNYIKKNKLQDKVKIVFFLHDCTVCRVKKDFAEEWGAIHIQLMEEAATVNTKKVKIPGDLTLTPTWVK